MNKERQKRRNLNAVTLLEERGDQLLTILLFDLERLLLRVSRLQLEEALNKDLDEVVVSLALLQVLVNDVVGLGMACMLRLEDDLFDADDGYDLLDHVGVLAVCPERCFLVLSQEPGQHLGGRVLVLFLLVGCRLSEHKHTLYFDQKHDQHFQRLSALLLLALAAAVVLLQLPLDPGLQLLNKCRIDLWLQLLHQRQLLVIRRCAASWPEQRLDHLIEGAHCKLIRIAGQAQHLVLHQLECMLSIGNRVRPLEARPAASKDFAVDPFLNNFTD